MISEDRFKVGYQLVGSTHHCALSDGRQAWFFDLLDGKVQQTPAQATTVDLTGGDARKYGTGDPHHTHLQQRTFEGGRGRYEFDEDESSYFDGGGANTMIPGRVAPLGQWRFGEGYNYADSLLPGAKRYAVGDDVHWVALTNRDVSYARSWVSSASYTAARLMLWVRKTGNPTTTLGVQVKANAADAPTGAALTFDTITNADFDEQFLSRLYEFDISHAQTSGTRYWAEVYISGSADDDPLNHWEVGYGTGAADTCRESTDAQTSYVPSGVQIYFRLAPALFPGQWRMFQMEGAFYVVGDRRDGTATGLYIVGDRGKATAGSTTTITQSGKSWVTNRWAGAWVRATKGTGRGQRRQIASNTATVLTFSAVDKAFDSTTEYVIYATDELTLITLSGDAISDPCVDVAVFDEQAVLCFGTESGDERMMRIKWDGTTSTHLGRDESGSEKADHLHACNDTTGGATVWRAENSQVTVSKAAVAVWGTDLSWGSDIDVGDAGWRINEITDHQGVVYIGKEDGPYQIAGEYTVRVNLGFDTMADVTNGMALLSWKLHLYMNWSASIEQIYGGNVNDVGPWRYAGLPAERTGFVSAMLGVHAFMVVAIDAEEDRTSSVLAWNEMGYHELFRAWTAGRRCQQVAWQTCPGTRDRMWISVGGDLVVMEFPLRTLNSLNDASYVYRHEWYVDTATFDMSAANLSKLFQKLVMTSENLQQGTEIEVLYQVDSEIGGDDWTPVAVIMQSPFAEALIGQGERRSMRLRYIGRTEDADNPAVLRSPVLEGMTRRPNKYAWSWFTGTSSWALEGGVGRIEAKPDDFVDWCEFVSSNAVELTLHSIFKRLDGIKVVLEPIVVGVQGLDKDAGTWHGDVSMTVREA